MLDLSGPYRKTFTDTLPHAVQVADPFHLVKLANQSSTSAAVGCRTRPSDIAATRHDPLYRSRRLLTKGHERLDEHGRAKLLGLLEAGDPHGEVRMTWHAKETVRAIYDITEPVDDGTSSSRGSPLISDESCHPRSVARPDASAGGGPDHELASRPGVATGRPKLRTT